MEMIQSPEFKDKKTRLIVFGILQIILGSLCSLAVLLVIPGIIAAQKKAAEGVDSKSLILGALFFVLLAAWFIWMGIGSIMAKRWARALILISSWYWLIGGVLGFIFVLWMMPHMYDKMSENGKISQAVITGMKIGMIISMSIFYVIIPGLLVLFYSGRNVKATCEYRDRKIRWTDKCPLPVLAISLMAAVGAISMLSMGVYNWAMPFFGIILSGAAGAGLILVLILLYAYAAWGLYKLDIKAWWCFLLVIICQSASTIITFSRVNIQDYYDKIGFTAQQLESMKQFDMYNTIWIWGVWSAVVIVYLLYIRKHFVSGRTDGNRTVEQ